jgi:hypothetical protein
MREASRLRPLRQVDDLVDAQVALLLGRDPDNGDGPGRRFHRVDHPLSDPSRTATHAGDASDLPGEPCEWRLHYERASRIDARRSDQKREDLGAKQNLTSARERLSTCPTLADGLHLRCVMPTVL